ncbi:flagellar filament capping protein FliD [Paraferrimonas sp. SM1919]|uniref:flagellar filament capping protein FliD n=1 Tax=Paraferrimonas sp. SM1919 TaxID=2662263 RepID=UPI0013D85C56|nr:flagellar filament capping protein FliD [Paraferrimonas sp. SM1919]
MFVSSAADMAYQFVMVERAPKDNLFQMQQARLNAQIDALNELKTKMSSFQSAMDELAKTGSFQGTAPTLSSEDYFTASSDANAVSASYDLYVKQLASAHQVSLQFGSEDAIMATQGDLTLSLGSDSFTIDMASLPAGAKLTDLRDAINAAGDNPGISASLIKSGDKTHLMLTSNETGAANQIDINFANYDAGETEANLLVGKINDRTERAAAQDAIIEVGSTNPLVLTSSSNTVTDAIPGVTLELTKAHTQDALGGYIDGPIKLDINQDDEGIKGQLQSFVDSYNELYNALKEATSSGDGEGSFGALSADGSMRSVISQLRTILNGQSADGLSLSLIGITTSRDGSLSIDSAKLDDAIANNSAGIENLFNETNGLIERLDVSIDSQIGVDGSIKTRTNSLQNRLGDIDIKIENHNMRMDRIYQRYLAQFTQMEAIQQQMNSTMSLFY